jgi:hypothetical protein
MTLAEWRAMLDGHAERERHDMRKRAWTLSHQLIAAGCDADKVSVAKLLGEKEKRSRGPKLTDEQRKTRSLQIAWQRVERDRAKAAQKAGE